LNLSYTESRKEKSDRKKQKTKKAYFGII